MIDVALAANEYGIEEPCEGLVTSDGNQLEGLCGSKSAVVRFKGHTKEHTATAPVIGRSGMPPILGMDVWKPHLAVFNMKENVITIDSLNSDIRRRWQRHNRAHRLLERSEIKKG